MLATIIIDTAIKNIDDCTDEKGLISAKVAKHAIIKAILEAYSCERNNE